MISKTLTGFICGLLSMQTITAQCLGNRAPGPLAFAPELSAAGGGFAVRSASPIAPTGVTVLSDQLAIEGPLVIDGNLPFLGTVALEGNLPSAGAGNVAHSCGGHVSISSEITPVSGAVVGSSLLGQASLGSGIMGTLSRGPSSLNSGIVGTSPLGPASLSAGMVGASPLGRAFGSGSGRLY